MSTELERFRDHARAMAADGAHLDDCHLQRKRQHRPIVILRPNPECAGCVPAADRALFAQLADEVEAHLDQPLALCDAPTDSEPMCTDAPDCEAAEHILACPGAAREQVQIPEYGVPPERWETTDGPATSPRAELDDCVLRRGCPSGLHLSDCPERVR